MIQIQRSKKNPDAFEWKMMLENHVTTTFVGLFANKMCFSSCSDVN